MADADDHGGGCSGGSDIIVCTAGAAPQTVVPPSAGIMGKSHSLSLSGSLVPSVTLLQILYRRICLFCTCSTTR